MIKIRTCDSGGACIAKNESKPSSSFPKPPESPNPPVESAAPQAVRNIHNRN